MKTLVDDLACVLLRDLEAFAREIALYPDDETLWRTPPGVSNAAGTLALHVAGNLQHFVGAQLGNTDYLRQREVEFSRREGSRAELIAGLETTAAAVRSTLAALDPARLEADFPLPIAGATLSTRRFLLHLATHLAFHLGQVGYLRRALTGDARTSDANSLKPLGV